MSAAELREAASLMRERAEAAGSAPWFAETSPAMISGSEGGRTYLRSSVWGTDSWSKGNTPYIAEANGKTDAAHIASWHPAVAIAVAALLDRRANLIDRDPMRFLVEGIDDDALAVARAYLNREA